MSYHNKVYVCYHPQEIAYYQEMKQWTQNDQTVFDFDAAQDLNQLETLANESLLKEKLKERMKGAEGFVILLSAVHSMQDKFIQLEIAAAIELKLAIIVVNLNDKRYVDDTRCPAVLKTKAAMHISFHIAIIQYALENWPYDVKEMGASGKIGPYRYTIDTYAKLGLN